MEQVSIVKRAKFIVRTKRTIPHPPYDQSTYGQKKAKIYYFLLFRPDWVWLAKWPGDFK